MSLSGAFAQTAPAKAKVNINTATQVELESLPDEAPEGARSTASLIVDGKATSGLLGATWSEDGARGRRTGRGGGGREEESEGGA